MFFFIFVFDIVVCVDEVAVDFIEVVSVKDVVDIAIEIIVAIYFIKVVVGGGFVDVVVVVVVVVWSTNNLDISAPKINSRLVLLSKAQIDSYLI